MRTLDPCTLVVCPQCGSSDYMRVFVDAMVNFYAPIDSNGIINVASELDRVSGSPQTLATFLSLDDKTRISLLLEINETDPESRPQIYCQQCSTVFYAPEGMRVKCQSIE